MMLVRIICWLFGHHLNAIDFRIYDSWACSRCGKDIRPEFLRGDDRLHVSKPKREETKT